MMCMDRPISIVGARVVQAAVNPDVAIADLAALAQRDPAFAARVLHVANSAGMGARTRVTDIRQGCARLGARALRNVALGMIVDDMTPQGVSAQVLIEITLRRAVAAKLVAVALGASGDEAFTVGLFLEVGILIDARADLPRALQIARVPAADRTIVERAFNLDPHVETSARLAVELGLSEEMSTAIARHHDFLPPASRPGEKLAVIAWAAERVAAAWEATDPLRARQEAVLALERLGMSRPAIEDVFEAVPAELGAAATMIQRNIAEPVDLTSLTTDAQNRLLELNQGYESLVRRLEELLEQKESLAKQLASANEELARAATLDPLTGLWNRRAFEQALRRDLARAARTKDAVSLVMLDVDHFKRLNDTYGHPIGDQVLIEVGRALRTSIRGGDFPTRVGGEEFIVILTNATAEQARLVAERIQHALERVVVSTPKGEVRVTASFGVAAAHADSTVEELVARVDGALYAAKQGGRNTVRLAA